MEDPVGFIAVLGGHIVVAQSLCKTKKIERRDMAGHLNTAWSIAIDIPTSETKFLYISSVSG